MAYTFIVFEGEDFKRKNRKWEPYEVNSFINQIMSGNEYPRQIYIDGRRKKDLISKHEKMINKLKMALDNNPILSFRENLDFELPGNAFLTGCGFTPAENAVFRELNEQADNEYIWLVNELRYEPCLGREILIENKETFEQRMEQSQYSKNIVSCYATLSKCDFQENKAWIIYFLANHFYVSIRQVVEDLILWLVRDITE